jgi:hypothetical protein
MFSSENLSNLYSEFMFCEKTSRLVKNSVEPMISGAIHCYCYRCVHDSITECVVAISRINLFAKFIPQNLLTHKAKFKIKFPIKNIPSALFKFFDICVPHQEIYKFLWLLFIFAVTWQSSILRKVPPILFPITLLHTVQWVPPVLTTNITENITLNLFFVAVWFSFTFRGYVIHAMTNKTKLSVSLTVLM